MFEPFMIKALICGMIIAIIGGFLGCIIVWRRLACFSDSISHSVLPGMALGFIFNVSIGWSAFFTAILISLFLGKLKDKIIVSLDTVLIIIAQIMFAIGLIILYSNPNINSNLLSLLLGDILAISSKEIIGIAICAFIVLTIIIYNWKKIVILCINEEIALSEGINTKFLNIIILLLTAVYTAIALQSVGIILSASILLIPPTTARRLSKTPLAMALKASLFGILGVCVGIICSYYIDIPTAPTIVLALGCILVVFNIKYYVRKN